MKLLVLAGNRTVQGGAETYLQALLPVLADHGHELALVYQQDPPDREAIYEGIPLAGCWEFRAGNTASVRAAVQAWRPDVIYAHHYQDPWSVRELVAGFPVVFYAHNYVGTCLSGFKRHLWPSPSPCSRTLGPGCLLQYYPRRCGGLSPFVMWKDLRYQQAMLETLRSCSLLLVNSEAMREEYLRHQFPPEKVKLVPLFPTAHVPEALPPMPRARTGLILLVGRLTANKGGAYLIAALAQLLEAQRLRIPLRLAVAGDGAEKAALITRAQILGVPADFHGWLPPVATRALMQEADLLAVPSLWPEPFGLVGIEAGCVGLPAVGYAHGGIPDWLVEGETGALAPSPPTVKGLAEAIVRALEDPAHHQRLRVGAWQRSQQFSVRRHVHTLEELFRLAARPTGNGALNSARP